MSFTKINLVIIMNKVTNKKKEKIRALLVNFNIFLLNLKMIFVKVRKKQFHKLKRVKARPSMSIT